MGSFKWQVGGCGCDCGCLRPCLVARETSVANVAALAERYYKRNARPLAVDGLAADGNSAWRELVAPPPGLVVDESVVAALGRGAEYDSYRGLTRPRAFYGRDGRWRDSQENEIAAPNFLGPVALRGCSGVESKRFVLASANVASATGDDAIVASRVYGAKDRSFVSSAYRASFAGAIEGTFADASVDVGDWESFGDAAGIWTTVRTRLRFHISPFKLGVGFPDPPDERLAAASAGFASEFHNASRSSAHKIWGSPSAAFYIRAGGPSALANVVAPSPTAAHYQYCEEFGYKTFDRGTSGQKLNCGNLRAEDVYDLDGNASLDGAASNFGPAATAPELIVYDGAAAFSRDVEFSFEWRAAVGWTVGGYAVGPSAGWDDVRAEILSYWKETLPAVMARYLEKDRPQPRCNLLLQYVAAAASVSVLSLADGPCPGFSEDEI